MQTPEFGDCVGVESSADFKSDFDFAAALSRSRPRLMAAESPREFPPPISWLARSENLPSHVPWVMKRYCTSDGRLIINEEIVDRREYFLANRSNGRLVMNLVHVDAVEKGGEEGGDPAEDQLPCDGADDRNGGATVEEVVSECYKYNGMGIKPCGGFVATAAAPLFGPPLHT